MKTSKDLLDDLDFLIEDCDNPEYEFEEINQDFTDEPDCLSENQEVKLCNYCENLGNGKCMNIGYC
jgi:hypothetical protein